MNISKIKLKAITLFCTVLILVTTCISTKIVMAANNLPGRIYVDSPTTNSKVNGNMLNIAGWSLNKTGVKQVQVSLDNGSKTNAKIGINRPDVNKEISGYKGGATSGFSGRLDISKVSYGQHTLNVISTGNDGAITSQNLTLYKIPSTGKNLPCTVYIDTPKSNSNVSDLNNQLTVSGWSLNGYGVQKVQVYIDNANKKDATIGQARNDVDKAMPGYTGGATSGYGCNLDISSITDGMHTIKVVSTGNDGKVTTSSVTVKKVSEKSMPGRIYVDSPTTNSKVNGNMLNIAGWSLNETGVKQVQVSLDNGSKTNAKIGINRPDVNKEIPGYTGGATSGYSGRLDISKVSYGQHTLNVISTGNDGVITSQNLTIYKIPSTGKNLPCTVYIDTPKSNSNVSDLNNQLTVSGWSLNGYGVQKVQVYIDNANEKDATIGQARNDVDKAIPGYFGGAASGYSCTLNVSSLTDGVHTIKVVSVGNDGTTTTNSVNVKKVSENNMPGIVCIDSPNYSKVNGSNLNVRGWSLDLYGVKQVQVSVDNGALKNAVIGGSRPDVAKYYQGYANKSSSGFSCDLNISALRSGIHKITVISTGVTGAKASNTTGIYVSPSESTALPNSHICIDTPSDNTSIESPNSQLYISGWSLNLFGVQKVQIYVDNAYNGDANVGLSRADVNNVLPGYSGGSNSGYNYNLNISAMSYGAHKLSVRSTGVDGKVKTEELTFYRDNVNSIAYKLSSFLVSQANISKVEAQAEALHKSEDPDNYKHNNCVFFSSSALRNLNVGINVPMWMANTRCYVPYLTSLGWARDYNVDSLSAGNICFTASDGSGYSTHTYVFMGWVDANDHTLAYVTDNQSPLVHIRSMLNTSTTDPFSFCFHN